MFYSIVIAIYNRADELFELLKSLKNQKFKNFEIIIVDDGSEVNLEQVINNDLFNDLKIKYIKKRNSGPGLSRNEGAKKAKGDYLIFLDSDCIIPENYLQNVEFNLNSNNISAFGGPDMAHEEFNHLQKAISYSMTSMLTTGGVRGGKKAVTKFQPRSFNMGIKRDIFAKLNGFSELRIGEDPDLSMTLWENNYDTSFFPNAGVYHKRRSTLKSFAKQVYQFGVARPILNNRHPNYKKITFWFPSFFLLFSIISILLMFFNKLLNNILTPYNINLNINIFILPIIFLLFYFLLIFINSSILNKNLRVGVLSIITSCIQLYSYGYGFLKSWITINIFQKDPKKSFPTHFYK